MIKGGLANIFPGAANEAAKGGRGEAIARKALKGRQPQEYQIMLSMSGVLLFQEHLVTITQNFKRSERLFCTLPVSFLMEVAIALAGLKLAREVACILKAQRVACPLIKTQIS